MRTPRFLCRLCELGRVFVLGAAFMLASADVVLGQDKEAPTTKEAWVISYALVLLCVGGGIFSVVRPTPRDPRK